MDELGAKSLALGRSTYKSLRLLIGLARTRVRYPLHERQGYVWYVGGVCEVNSLNFDRPRVSVQNFSFLACLEVAEKFVVGGGGGWVVCKPILVFSLSLSQAEQY